MDKKCRIAVTSMGRDLKSRVGPIARSPYIIVFEGSPDKFSVIEERHIDARNEPGVKTAETLVSKEIGTVITGTIGKRAHEVLSRAGISIKGGCKGSVEEAVRECAAGRLADCHGAKYAGNVEFS
ncbi:MAG: NifB/NifX family molybdenum-iron cluster-binding protein [Methanomassiliicoccales archaeon]|nr:MAG: NifB/NifX family molybdenum-iron cluster-binding protein [Methanomassiliicoccales archaeon]